MSRSKQPDAAGPRSLSGKLSKVTGAGIGTGIIVLAEAFDMSAKVRLVIQCLAPTIAVVIAAVGPYVTMFLHSQAKLLGLKYIRRQIRELEQSVDPSAENKADLQAKTREVESMIAEHLASNARSWMGLSSNPRSPGPQVTEE